MGEMIVLSRAGIPSTRLLSSSSSSSILSLPSTSCAVNYFKSSIPTRHTCHSFHIKPIINPKPYLIDSKRVSLKTHYGKWEEPDDGDYSDYDSEDEKQDNWEEEEEDDENEEPDDGHYSDYDSQDEKQDNWEEEEDDDEDEEPKQEQEQEPESETASLVGNVKTITEADEILIREVEQLLEPEERAILEQNEAPVVSKISTAKWNPLHTFALTNQITSLGKLLEEGVDIDAVDKDGYTALHAAVIAKKEPAISHLLIRGANPHVRDRNGATPLHYAIQVGAILTVKLLINKYNVDVNVADDEGWTPLHVAVQTRSRDITKVLLVNGADRTRRNKDGKTPLDLSLCFGKDFKSYELAKLLKLVPANTDS